MSNQAGTSKQAQYTVVVSDLAIVRGKACSAGENAGWCWQRPLPQGNAIRDYVFVGDTHGWAVGDGGTVMHTADGGLSWKRQTSGIELHLTHVTFVNRQVGWVVGPHGHLLKTADGGHTWQAVTTGGTHEGVLSLGASDHLTAWVVSNYRIRVTRDGGASWTDMPHNSYSENVTAVSADVLWTRTYAYPAAGVRRSTDGGKTWVDLTLPAPSPNMTRSIDYVLATDAATALAIGSEYGYDSALGDYVSRQIALRTMDSGASWQALNALPQPGYCCYAGSYRMIDADTLFAFMGSTLSRSPDGGASWQSVTMPSATGSYWASFEAFSAQRLLLVDAEGRAYLTIDGGANWTLAGAGGGALPSITSLWFFDSREGLALAADGSRMRTADGGRTWLTTAPIVGSYSGWRSLQFLPAGDRGWAVSDAGQVLLSLDRGRNWLAPAAQSSPPLSGVRDVHFVDALRGWAVAWSYGQNAIYSSIDGGLSWTAMDGTPYQSLASIRFADASHGVAVGPPGYVMLSTDGGAHWSARPTGSDRSMSRLAFVDATTAVAVGEAGTILRSTDKGQNWKRISSPTTSNLSDVRFASAPFGYAVGDTGVVLVTTDGGLTWAVQSSGSQASLKAAFFIDERTGWIAGDNGNVLATATGGP